jgi:tetratricopeptide (TPR) repeat protein
MSHLDVLRHVALVDTLERDEPRLLDAMVEQAVATGDEVDPEASLSDPPDDVAAFPTTSPLARTRRLDWNGYEFEVSDAPTRERLERAARWVDGVVVAVDPDRGPTADVLQTLRTVLQFECRPVVALVSGDEEAPPVGDVLERLLVFTDASPDDASVELASVHVSEDGTRAARREGAFGRDLSSLFGVLVESVPPPRLSFDGPALSFDTPTLLEWGQNSPEGESPIVVGRLLDRSLESGDAVGVLGEERERQTIRVERLWRLSGREAEACSHLERGDRAAVMGRPTPGDTDEPTSSDAPISVEAARRADDPERLYDALWARAERVDDPDDSLADLRDATDLARRELDDALMLRALDAALEIAPGRRDILEAIASHLAERRDWERLASIYERALEDCRAIEVEPGRRAELWFELGRLRETRLERQEAALEAYRDATELSPRSPDYHEAAAELAASSAIEDDDLAEHHWHALLELEPERIDVLNELGGLHLQSESIDAALWHYHTCEAVEGTVDERGRQLLNHFATGMYNSADGVLDDALRREHLYPSSLDLAINEVFRLLFPVLYEWTSEFRSEYGLGADDQVDLDDPLAFNNIYRDVATSLGWPEPPDLWHDPSRRGLAQGALDEPIVIAGDDLFGSGDERRIAFAVAKTLVLLEQPFYLIGIRSFADLQAFFMLALQLVHPDIEGLERDEAMADAYREMEQSIVGERRERLDEAIDAATDADDEIDLGRWYEAVEDTANRVGLLFAGELNVARTHLEEADETFSQRSVDQRFRALADYARSDDHLALREALGLSIG